MKAFLVTSLILAAQTAFALPMDDAIKKLEQQNVKIDRSQVDQDSIILCLVNAGSKKKILVGLSNDPNYTGGGMASIAKQVRLNNGLKLALRAVTYADLSRGGIANHAYISSIIQNGNLIVSSGVDAFLFGTINPDLRGNLAPLSIKTNPDAKPITGFCGYTEK